MDKAYSRHLLSELIKQHGQARHMEALDALAGPSPEKVEGSIAPGAVLKNGGIVLAYKEERDRAYVLCLRCSNRAQGFEFVTWAIDEHGDTTSGNYFQDLESALQDWKKRS